MNKLIKKSTGFTRSSLWFGPVFMLCAFLIVFGAILWLMHERTNRNRRGELVVKAESIGESLRLRLHGNTDYLQMLAQERSAGTLGAASFQERASQYVKFHPEIINITWVDNDYVIRDVAPLAPNRQILGLRLNLPEPKRVSRLAMESRQPVYTRPFEAIQGKPSFEIWVPVYRGDTFLGLFGGVYSCEQVLKQLISAEQRKLYHLSVVDSADGLLGELPLSGLVDESLVHTLLLTSKDSGVFLRLQGYRQEGQDWRLLVLELLCLALVLGMVYAVWSLKREIEERKRTGDALKISQARLEETMQQANIAHWEYDALSNEFIFNDTFYEMLGTSTQNEGGERMRADLFAGKFIHPEDAYIIGGAIQNALTSKDPGFACQVEARELRVDGGVLNVIVRFTTTIVENGIHRASCRRSGP